jgi:UDP-3-O-[3-hydroxymyristoyl] N-acetylglucosamine deacetylase/3-hydroxyacyl-[acyl-carrier-protein] dehydratase
MGVDNVLIQVNGPEIPIVDGSSAPFIELIDKAGVLEQDATKQWYSIDEKYFSLRRRQACRNGFITGA